LPEPSVTAQDLIDFARSRLAAYKCPTEVHFVEQLPHTASGKLQRSALREPTAAVPPAPITADELVSGVSDA
jgi:long-chain acyl-CoA synthetase